MAGRWLRRAVVLLGLTCGLALGIPAVAQKAEDADALNAEVLRLYREGKYAAAVPLAQRAMALREKALGPDHPDVSTALNNLAVLYQHLGRYAEIEPLYKRSLALREKALGPEHPDVATTLGNLAALYRAQGRYAEAEPLFKRSLAILEKALGPEHPGVATTLGNLAALYRAQGRYAEAEPLYKRSLALRERALGPGHPDVATALNNLALLYESQGRYDEAEPLHKRSMAVREKVLGPEHPDVATALNNLAALHESQGRYVEAEPLFKRSLAIREKALGPAHLDVAIVLNNLAALYKSQGRYAEAEPLHKRSLALREKALGPDHADVGTSLNNLALLYESQSRHVEAEPLFKRSLAIRERALGPDHPDVGTTLGSLAELYRVQGRYAEAEPLYKRSLSIWEKALGPAHRHVGAALNNLALVYESQGRYAEAEPLYKRSLAIREKVLGPDHPDVGTTLNNLAALYQAQGRTAVAEPLIKRTISIFEVALGPDHPDVSTALNNLAALYLAQRDWARAADYWRRSIVVLQRRAERGLAGTGMGSTKGEAQRSSFVFSGFVKVAHRLATQGQGPWLAQAREIFETAQWAQGSEAAASLAQMAARSAKGAPELAVLVRERQDLVAEWQMKDIQLIAAKSEPPAKRNGPAEQALSDRIKAIDTRLAAIDARFARDFPDYAALSSPKPVSIVDVQAELRDDEALVLLLDTDDRFKPVPEETFVWAVTKTDLRWVRSELGTAALQREVAALRCGLDASAWNREGAKRCADLLKLPLAKASKGDDPLPFDLARAHGLFKSLFGEVEDLIRDKHLLIVPSGSLTALPFQVLVTEPPQSGAGYGKLAWLGTRNAVSVLPAVSSLKALRSHAKASRASDPFIAFGNPLLTGPDGTDKRASARQNCPAPGGTERVRAALSGPVRKAESLFLGGLANVEEVRRQPPLPETADEVCAVARALGVAKPDAAVHLGARATEARVKALSADGTLARARVVHFATHGLIAGETASLAKSRAEPALMLTPPDRASETDDGLLTASEVAALKLDADWVILSACNTAAGDALGGDALSGLARAFFYAGARTLLVSHWYVDSDATVALITKAFDALKADPKIGRAEVMRRAMTALIAGGGRMAEPANWAPFVVVGEGGAGR